MINENENSNKNNPCSLGPRLGALVWASGGIALWTFASQLFSSALSTRHFQAEQLISAQSRGLSLHTTFCFFFVKINGLGRHDFLLCF
jgi:hypothetical protein